MVGAFEPVIVSTPESLTEAVNDPDWSEVVLSTSGGTTIVAVADDVSLDVVTPLVADSVPNGGKGEAAIDERPFGTSELVKVLATSVDVVEEATAVGCEFAVVEVVEFIGIEVRPCAMLLVTVEKLA